MIQIKIETLGLVFCFGRNIDLVIPMDDRCCEFVLVFVSNKTMIQCRRRAWSASRMSASPWEPCVGVRSPRRGRTSPSGTPTRSSPRPARADSTRRWSCPPASRRFRVRTSYTSTWTETFSPPTTSLQALS